MSPPRYGDRATPSWARALLAALLCCAALYAVILVGGAEPLGTVIDPGQVTQLVMNLTVERA